MCPMKRGSSPLTGDCLMEVTSRAGLTVSIFLLNRCNEIWSTKTSFIGNILLFITSTGHVHFLRMLKWQHWLFYCIIKDCRYVSWQKARLAWLSLQLSISLRYISSNMAPRALVLLFVMCMVLGTINTARVLGEWNILVIY